MDKLASNVVTTFTLNDAFKPVEASSSNHVTIQFARQQVPVDLVKPVFDDPTGAQPDMFADLPPRRSSLNDLGNAHLTASLGDYLGHGHCGLVYALEDMHVTGAPDGVAFPPLVVKIARLNRVASLLRETWFYDEMECLQGVAIPRCYGYFEAEFSENGSEKALLQTLFKKFPGADESEGNPTVERDRCRGPLHPLLEERDSHSRVVAVLILEKLGPRLPVGVAVSEETREDIRGLYEEIGHLCIDNVEDIRYKNILQAPAPPPGLPSLPSPFTKRVHKWRLVDFELAMQVNYSISNLEVQYLTELDGIFYDMEHGCEEDYENLMDDDEEDSLEWRDRPVIPLMLFTWNDVE
ncbi:uncharacterized protein PHACADRAFT_251185 [Phanerochaete carnosa HHB-10118-sp]|uniref:Protein kinase domain-containing protein n=1 Tax=Phanerochaete carnosa (strain HHB-10118-sp) TaxID=650164 RepID=K5WEL8_PHACS|nr:uncharacterized protein PHACADRAFT_251185 [Phanerochaete carnosa HHB-10118-sp]EKM57514.1 hypothetical protein PHACADRAFT_251185 [Phanerochaete carnosa HHB-10118-sp]